MKKKLFSGKWAFYILMLVGLLFAAASCVNRNTNKTKVKQPVQKVKQISDTANKAATVMDTTKADTTNLDTSKVKK